MCFDLAWSKGASPQGGSLAGLNNRDGTCKFKTEDVCVKSVKKTIRAKSLHKLFVNSRSESFFA